MEARHQEILNLIDQADNSASGAETLICEALKLILIDIIEKAPKLTPNSAIEIEHQRMLDASRPANIHPKYQPQP